MYGGISWPYLDLVSRLLGQREGQFDKWTVWTPNSFAVTILWYQYIHQGKYHLKVKVISEPKFNFFDFYNDAGGEPSTVGILVAVVGAFLGLKDFLILNFNTTKCSIKSNNHIVSMICR